MSKLDTSLNERKEIINYLKRVEQKRKLTLKELKVIGDKLSKMSKLKIKIILKNFDLTENKKLLKRYSLLMGYLKDESLIDPLLERYFTKEKSENYKSAIISILKSYDIDISSLLINDLLDTKSASFKSLCIELLNEAEKNELILAYFIEGIFYLDDRNKEIFLNEFLRVGGDKALKLIEVLAESGDEVIEKIAVEILGKVRNTKSANILNKIKHFAFNDKIRMFAERNLRKLSFLMIYPDEVLPEKNIMVRSFVNYLGGIDGTGNRGLWIYFKNNLSRGININILLNEEWGIVDCYSNDSTSKAEFDRMITQIKREEHIMPVPFDYAFALVNDAISLNLSKGIPFPPEFIIRKKYFYGIFQNFREYVPVFKDLNLESIKKDKFYLHASASLFNLPEFEDWIILNSVIFDYVELYKKLRDNFSGNKEQISFLLKRIYEGAVADKLEQLKRRLFLMAEFYYKFYQRKKTLSKILLSAALNLDSCNEYLYAVNPFIRALIINSLENAGEAMDDKLDFGEFSDK